MPSEKFAQLTNEQLAIVAELEGKDKLDKTEASTLKKLKKKQDTPEELTQSCKDFLVRTYAIEKYYSGRGLMPSRILKGSQVESQAMDLFIESEGGVHYNRKRKLIKNGYITGVADLYDGTTPESSSEIVEIKSSWNIFSFLTSVNKPLKRSIYWQLQGYLSLTNAKVATVAFCLVNTPDAIIEAERKRVEDNRKMFEDDEERHLATLEELAVRMKFDDIPVNERVLKFTVNRNEDDINRIPARVEMCRQYLADFETQHTFFTKNHRREKLLALKNGK
jgi:hypothetical protein